MWPRRETEPMPEPPPNQEGPLENAAPEWSIVVIARNEAATIEACLASVQRAFAELSHEVIFVDSASTDDTVTIARRFPVRVVSVPDNWPKRPAIGRHIGWTLCRGTWILFLDGDCVFEGAWLAPAIEALNSDPTLAAVAGASRGVLRGADGHEIVGDQYPDANYDDPEHLSGSAVYRRSALERAGGFNPFLRAHEEPELGARLRKLGYRLRRLRVTMTSHYPKEQKETVFELLRRATRRYPVGLGQFVRHAISADLPVQRPWKTIDRHLTFLALLALGVVTGAVWVFGGGGWMLAAWAALFALVFAAFALKARSITKPAYYFLEWMLTAPMVLYGLLLPPRSANEFMPMPSEDTDREEPAPASSRRGRELVFGLVAMSLAVLVGLIASEIATRIFKPQMLFRYPKGMYEAHPSRGYRLSPGFRGEMVTPEYRTKVAINNLGMRDDADVSAAHPGTVRIVAIGDSFTMGVGVEHSETFLELAERDLQRRGSKVEILNTGVPGYGTREEIDVLAKDVDALRPDLILLCFFIGNDLWDNARPATLHVRDGDLVDNEPTGGTLPPALRSFLARHSHLYHLLWPYQRLLFGNDGADRRGQRRALSIFGPVDGDAREAWAATERYLDEFLALAASRKLPTAVVLIPDPLQVDRDHWQAVTKELDLTPSAEALDIPNRRLTEVLERYHLPVLDLLPTLRTQLDPASLYLPVDKHWTREGNRVAGTALASFLADRGLATKPEGSRAQ